MKVITWNCNMAFRKKSKFIDEFEPDILIVPECEHPEKIKFERQPNDVFWYGQNKNKGLAVFSFTNFKINLLDFHEENYRMILPLNFSTPTNIFTVFAVWAYNPKDPFYKYIGQVWKAVQFYQKQMGNQNTMLVGDFNSNSIWDKLDRKVSHTEVVGYLSQQGFESAYHKFYELPQGQEKHPTLYMYRHENKPYHIDYCFVSSDLVGKLKSVQVGEYSKWSQLSDHMPLIVEFD
ncbi:MAG: endonuclease/exonuclease/phosphatase family protein [Saprospiraceae bacterium]|nr:endonuclease/exonuclease/phosphatase family protein [Saprospiraceae bacterium]